MLGRLRLPDAKPVGNRSHRERFTKQRVDDLQGAWFGESSERFQHLAKHPTQGIFWARNIRSASGIKGCLKGDNPAENSLAFTGRSRVVDCRSRLRALVWFDSDL